MKTDKFEKIIRQKLESISPDFQEDNWAQMQRYMQLHNPPGFWQQYGSWFGYAAAASITTVMAFMYSNQLSQTNELKQDLTELRKEIRMMNTVSLASSPDTVYLVQKEIVREPVHFYADQDVRKKWTTASGQNGVARKELYAENHIAVPTESPSVAGNISGERNHDLNQERHPNEKTELPQHSEAADFSESTLHAIPTSNNTSFTSRALDDSFGELTELAPVTPENESARTLKYALASRISPRQTRKVWLASVAPVTRAAVDENKKVEKTAKADNIIPRFNIKAPYRVGAGYQFEGNNQVKTVVGEVLIGKKFSLSTGLSWLRIKPMNFKSEKVFRDKIKGDFKQMHPGEVPVDFQVQNISVKPTVLQIPLTLAFRNDVAKDFSYFVGAGTNITLNGKEKITYDCRLPLTGKEFNNQSLERKMDLQLFNSVNITAGIEKSWHPVVVQIEGYLYSYFKPLTPLTQKTGPGIKMKLLYQIGKKM